MNAQRVKFFHVCDPCFQFKDDIFRCFIFYKYGIARNSARGNYTAVITVKTGNDCVKVLKEQCHEICYPFLIITLCHSYIKISGNSFKKIVGGFYYADTNNSLIRYLDEIQNFSQLLYPAKQMSRKR